MDVDGCAWKCRGRGIRRSALESGRGSKPEQKSMTATKEQQVPSSVSVITGKNLELAYHEAEMTMESVTNQIVTCPVRKRAAEKIKKANKFIVSPPVRPAKEQMQSLPLPSSSLSTVLEDTSAVPSTVDWKKTAEEQQVTIMKLERKVQELEEKLEDFRFDFAIRDACLAGLEVKFRDTIARTYHMMINDIHSSLVSVVGAKPNGNMNELEPSPRVKMIMDASATDNATAAMVTPIIGASCGKIKENDFCKPPSPLSPALLEVIKMLTPEDIDALNNIDCNELD